MLRHFEPAHRPSSPVIVSRWLDVAFAGLWLVVMLWGIVSGFAGIQTLNNVAGTVTSFQAVWSFSIALLAFIALCAISLTFLPAPIPPLRRKKVELYAVILLTGLIAVYPCSLIYLVLVDGDIDRLALATISLSYPIFPVWRAGYLRGKIMNYVE